MKDLQSITQTDADHLLDRILTAASEDHKKPVSVAVVDVHGHPLQALRMDGASVDSFWIALAKAETAVRGGKDTVEIAHKRSGSGQHWVRTDANQHRADDNRRVVNPRFVSWAGGCVVMKDGQVVGGVAVSGRD